METVTLFFLITLVFTVGWIFLAGQALMLARIRRSSGGYLKAVGFSIIGLIMIWGFIRLPIALMKNPGIHLGIEEWVKIVAYFIGMVFLILGQDRTRRDYLTIGM